MRIAKLVAGFSAFTLASCVPSRPPAHIVSPVAPVRVQTPPLLHPGSHARSRVQPDGGWVVEYRDDLCRQYALSMRADTAAGSMAERVRDRVLPDLVQKGVVELQQRTVRIEGIGDAELVRFRHPKSFACEAMAIGPDGKRKQGPFDAEVAELFFVRDGVVYRAAYVHAPVAPHENLFGIRVAPPEAVLEAFVRGLEFPGGAK